MAWVSAAYRLVLPVPDAAGPVRGAGEEDLVPERVAAHLVDGPCVSEVVVEVLLFVGLGAAVDGAVLGGDEVDVVVSGQEVEAG